MTLVSGPELLECELIELLLRFIFKILDKMSPFLSAISRNFVDISEYLIISKKNKSFSENNITF